MSDVLPLRRTRSFYSCSRAPDLEEPSPVGSSPKIENLIVINR